SQKSNEVVEKDIWAEKDMSREKTLAYLVKTGKFEDYLKNASENISMKIRGVKEDFLTVNSVKGGKLIEQYHQMLINTLEVPFSNFYGYKNVKQFDQEENEFDFHLENLNNQSDNSIMKRGILGVSQIRMENNLSDYLNVKNAGEMCFSEAVRRLNLFEGDISFAAQQIQMIFQNNRSFSYEDRSNEVLIFSLLRSIDLLSQKYPSKLTVLNPLFLKLNNNIAMNILLRTGDKSTINRILNKEFDIFTDNERGIEILRTFFKIVIKED
ncbi:Vesicle coat complex COPI, gamma subunit, partial [Pseudoloma neurophilia]